MPTTTPGSPATAASPIAVFDKNGKPLTPPEGITLNGQLGLMQGIIVASNGDVWVLGISKNQLVHFPKGDLTKGRIVCEGRTAEPCKSFSGPFHLAIDQQDRIWVSNGVGDFVTRFPATDPSKVETFKAGYSGSGLNIDSQGNVWVTNRLGSAERGKVAFEKFQKIMSTSYDDEFLVRTMYQQRGADGGSVTLLRPDGTQYPGSPFVGGGLPGPWAAVVDGNDNVWISNFAMASSPIVQLCGVRTENVSAGHEDRRSDLATGRLCRRWPADADRSCPRACWRCLGDEQLADHRQLLRHSTRGALDALRRPGRDDFLRYGQTGPHAADRAGTRAIVFGGAPIALSTQDESAGEPVMMITRRFWIGLLVLGAAVTAAAAPASAQSTLNGQVLGAGAPIANATVTLWVASAGAPAQLAQAKTGAGGGFALTAPSARAGDAALYLVAKGGN